MMLVENKYEIGQEVFLTTDTDQMVRIVVGILVRKNDISYNLVCGASDSWHYEFEMQTEKTIA